MNRSWDIFRTSANGMDADRGTARWNDPRSRTTHHDAGIPHHFDEHDATWWRAQDSRSLHLDERDVRDVRDVRDEDHPSLWQRVKGAFHGVGPKNWKRSDDRIREEVCEHLCYHPYVDASDIEVIVRDGEVTLTGTVDARLVKRAAEDAAHDVRGVVDVHNQLRVRRPG